MQNSSTPIAPDVGRHEVIIPPLAVPPRPFEVRVRESVGDTVTLIGHDSNGVPLVETKIPKRLMREGMTERLRRFCIESDEPEGLRIL